MTMRRYHSTAWLRPGFLVLFRPTSDSLAEYGERDRMERVGQVQDIRSDQVRIRTVAPDIKSDGRRKAWETIAFLDAKPEDIRPLDNPKLFRLTKRSFARLDADRKRDVGGRRR